MKADQVKEIVEATAGLSAGSWIAIIAVGVIALGVVIVLNLDKINKFLFGDRKTGLLTKDPQQGSNITQYISGWHKTIKLADSLKLSSTENLLEFLKAEIADVDSKKVAEKQFTVDLTETDKINSTGIKDITSFIELCINEFPQVDVTILIAPEPSEQLRLSKDIWLALVNSFRTGGRNDINVNVIYK